MSDTPRADAEISRTAGIGAVSGMEQAWEDMCSFSRELERELTNNAENWKNKWLSALNQWAEEKRASAIDNAPEMEPREALASRLIDAWCANKGKQIPWAKAVQIVAIVTKQSDAERDRLLHLGNDDDGKCPVCGRSTVWRTTLNLP